MPDASDTDLLRDYARSRTEEAFAELVRRHINLVYSAALRHVGIPAQAEEITQAVFIILARKVESLRPNLILESWLYETTRLTSLSFLRGERRRQFREQEAYMQSTFQETEDDAVWSQLAPLLDEAMSKLGTKDRDAVILRYFKDKSVREVATALNINEGAAQRRVLRALEKLRKFFANRGVNSTTAIIGEKISAHSIHAAPTALAKSVTTVAIAKGGAASASTLTLIKGAMKIMAWSKAKTTIVAGVAVLLVAATGTTTVKVVQAHQTYPWQVPKADFNVFYQMQPAVKIVPTKFAQDGSWCGDGGRGAMGIAQPLETIVQVAYRYDALHTVVEADLPKAKYDFIAKLVGPQEPHKNMPTDEHWAEELQKQIKRQFGITGNVAMRDKDVLMLRPVDTGARGFNASHSMPHGHAIDAGAGSLSFFEQPVWILVHELQRYFKRPVVDKTGLTGAYDFSLKWDEPDRKQPNLDGLKQALAEQLGLELVETNMPIQMLVIEKAK